MIVIDASAAIDVILKVEPVASRIYERMEISEDGFHVPHFFELEVLSVLRRYSLSGKLSENRAREALEDLMAMRLIRYPHTSFIGRIWNLRDNVTTYDAAYIALAETLDAPLVTTDGRLARSSGHRASIELFG